MSDGMSQQDIEKLKNRLAVATLSELKYSANVKDGIVTSHSTYNRDTADNIYMALRYLGLNGRHETDYHSSNYSEKEIGKFIMKPEEDFIVKGDPRKFETGFGHISNDMTVSGDDSLTVTITPAGAFKLAKAGVESPVLEAFLPKERKQQPESFVKSVSAGIKIPVKEI